MTGELFFTVVQQELALTSEGISSIRAKPRA